MLRHRHLLLRLLKLRILVNDIQIYEVNEKQPVVITGTAPITKVMVTNGFHHSRTIGVKYKPGIIFYEVASAIDNIQLFTGLAMVLLFFIIYIFSGIFFFMLFANLPILIMLYMLYIRKDDFIQLHVIERDARHTGK